MCFEDLNNGVYGSSWIQDQSFSALPNIIHNSLWVPIDFICISIFLIFIHTLFFVVFWVLKMGNVVGCSAREEVERCHRPLRFRRNVVVSPPHHLFSLLRILHYIWLFFISSIIEQINSFLLRPHSRPYFEIWENERTLRT